MRGNNGLAQLNVRVTIPEGRELRTEFCIEIDSELLAGQVHRILKLACKERNWDIPPPPPPPIKDGRGKEPIIELPIKIYPSRQSLFLASNDRLFPNPNLSLSPKGKFYSS